MSRSFYRLKDGVPVHIFDVTFPEGKPKHVKLWGPQCIVGSGEFPEVWRHTEKHKKENAAENIPWFIPHVEEKHDPVNHPKHYTDHPSGVECIQITEHMGFNLGNAVKYIWRADLKHDAIEDLKKAKWYIERELAKRDR